MLLSVLLSAFLLWQVGLQYIYIYIYACVCVCYTDTRVIQDRFCEGRRE